MMLNLMQPRWTFCFMDGWDDDNDEIMKLGFTGLRPHNSCTDSHPLSPASQTFKIVSIENSFHHQSENTFANMAKRENIATGETSQDITPFHFFNNFNFHH